MRRTLSILLAVVATFAIAGGALAAKPEQTGNPHWIGTPTASVSGNTLTVSFSAAGLGSVSTADFSLSGSVEVYSRCYNRGGNKPQAENKQETLDVNVTRTFDVRNGRTNGSISVSPVSTLSCPGNQVVVIESVDYSNLVLTGPGDLYFADF